MANKLKHCIVNKNKDFLIQVISDASDHYGDKLLAFMDKYHLISLQEATEAQLEAFILDDLKGGSVNARNAEIGSQK